MICVTILDIVSPVHGSNNTEGGWQSSEWDDASVKTIIIEFKGFS